MFHQVPTSTDRLMALKKRLHGGDKSAVSIVATLRERDQLTD